MLKLLGLALDSRVPHFRSIAWNGRHLVVGFASGTIPALAFKFGYEFGSPEEQIRRGWVRERYPQV